MRPSAPLVGLLVAQACGGSDVQRSPRQPVATVEMTTEPEAAPIEEGPTAELSSWEQLLNGEGVFLGAQQQGRCEVGERAFVLVVGPDAFDRQPLAEQAGCRVVGEVQKLEVGLCCPEALQAPAVGRNGSGASCEASRQEYLARSQPSELGEDQRPSAGMYGAVLNRGTYLKPCSLPAWMAVDLCAAVVDGVASGVSVRTFPASAQIGDCIADEVRKLEFPTHPKLDITITKFSAD